MQESKKTISKKIRYAGAFIVLILAVVFSWQGYSELKDATSSKSGSALLETQIEKTLRESNTFAQFNDPQFNIQFNYPAYWEKTQDKGTVHLQTLNNLVQIWITSTGVSSGLPPGVARWTPDTHFDELKKQLQLQEMNRSSVVVAGIEGKKANFELMADGTKMKLEVRAFVKGETMYIVQFISSENDGLYGGLYDRFYPIFEKVIISFQSSG